MNESIEHRLKALAWNAGDAVAEISKKQGIPPELLAKAFSDLVYTSITATHALRDALPGEQPMNGNGLVDLRTPQGKGTVFPIVAQAIKELGFEATRASVVKHLKGRVEARSVAKCLSNGIQHKTLKRDGRNGVYYIR